MSGEDSGALQPQSPPPFAGDYMVAFCTDSSHGTAATALAAASLPSFMCVCVWWLGQHADALPAGHARHNAVTFQYCVLNLCRTGKPPSLDGLV